MILFLEVSNYTLLSNLKTRTDVYLQLHYLKQFKIYIYLTVENIEKQKENENYPTPTT